MPSKSLRTTKLHSTKHGTAWFTKAGALFIETAQRPEGNTRVLEITLNPKDYRLLEVLHDDVATFIEKLVTSHCAGLRKSYEYNKRQKEQRKQNGKQAA